MAGIPFGQVLDFDGWCETHERESIARIIGDDEGILRTIAAGGAMRQIIQFVLRSGHDDNIRILIYNDRS